MPQDYDDWLDEVNPPPTDAELNRMEKEYRARARESAMDRFFAEWNARFTAQFDGIDAQIAGINQTLTGESQPAFARSNA